MLCGDALKALIVVSANDVAIMIAEGVAGSDEAFVQRAASFRLVHARRAADSEKLRRRSR
jgi:predicted O-linked N-acetylglucosamine transferase (SPINDLY family)